jgi:predicted PurR-regulated permease PerM
VTVDRRFVLGALLGLLTLGAAAMLADVIGTVFFAVTVAYLLSPLREELGRRRLSPWGPASSRR